METIKIICCAKGKGEVDYGTVTRCFKKFYVGFKKLNNQARLARPKTMDSGSVLKPIEANPVSSTWRVSGKPRLSQSSVVHHLHNLGKSILSC